MGELFNKFKMIVDAHAHLYLYGKAISQVIERSRRKEVKYIIENGLNYETNLIVLEESKNFDIILPALGLHPTELTKRSSTEIERVLRQIEENKDRIVAIGEVGLDFYKESDEILKQNQIKLFNQILELAERIKKPVIIHSRGAEGEVISLLSSYDVIPILHSYTGKISLARTAINDGTYFSIPAIVYRHSQFQRLVDEIPVDLLLTETDSPFLDPIDFRRNEPWKIYYGLKRIAEIKKIELEELENKIYDNFRKIFLEQ